MTLMSKTCGVGWRRRKTKSDGRGTGPELLITHYTSEQHIFLDVVAPLGTAMSICRSGINHIVMSLSSCDAKGAVPDSNSKMLNLRTLFFLCNSACKQSEPLPCWNLQLWRNWTGREGWGCFKGCYSPRVIKTLSVFWSTHLSSNIQ